MKRQPALVKLLRHREPALLVTGQTISNLGDGIALIALTLLIIHLTHSASELAWFAAARMIPLVAFLLVGGAIVDRFSRRLLLLISDSMRALLTATLVVMLLGGWLHYWELLVFAVLFGTFDAVFMPAIQALTPEIVPEELLGAMNAMRPLSNNVMGNMIGPALGGLIAAFSYTWAIGVDCATFVVSAATLVLMRPTPHPERSEGSTMIREIREGITFVRRTTWMWTTLLSVTFVNAFVLTPMFVLLPFFMKHTLHASGQLVGYAVAVSGLSGGIGALVASNLKMPRRRIRTMWTYWLISSFALLIMGIATRVWEVALIFLMVSPTIILGNVIWESMMQSEVPRELLGRATSVDWFASLGLSPVGLVIAGWLATAVGVRTYFVVFALIASMPGVLIMVSRRVNAIDHGRLALAPES